MSTLGNSCPYWRNDVRPCEKYDNDCSWCKIQWGENKREQLLEEYIQNYDKPKIVKALNCDAVGDCTIQFKNNKKDVYHCSLLEEIKE